VEIWQKEVYRNGLEILENRLKFILKIANYIDC